jgi:F-type H+-transporting ATPase subunit epsilon
MQLEILLPFHVFTEMRGVRRIVAQTRAGSFGLLPHRLDCVAALTPGILVYETAAQEENYVAVDEGILVKAGTRVRVSVRRALAGSNLDQLRAAVEEQFLTLDAREQDLRHVMNRLESGFVQRMARFEHGP